MTKSSPVYISWILSFIVSFAWFIMYFRDRASNVPLTEGVLVFMQYYLAFGILFGWIVYWACRTAKWSAIRVFTVAASHGCYLWLLVVALTNLPTGSFFSGHAP